MFFFCLFSGDVKVLRVRNREKSEGWVASWESEWKINGTVFQN